MLHASEIEARTRPSFVTKTKTVCTFCGVGCSFDVWTRGRKILQIQPRPESPANGMATCIKGKFGWDFVNSPDRLTTPLLRDGDHFRPASWEEAIRFIAERLRAIRDSAGPDAIGFLANCTGSNEEAWLVQKLARTVIGTHNVDNCARYCQAPASTGLSRTVGIGADAGGFREIENADLVMTVGSNTAKSHPVLAGKIKRAHKLRGQKLVVLDLRRTMMAERADLFVRPRPGTDLVVLNTVARYLLDQGWEARSFIEQRTTNFEAYRESLAPFTLDYGETVTGVAKDEFVRLATMVHDAKSVCILWAMGVTQHQPGTETSTAICDLLLLTGNFGRPGTGGYPLRGHCNVQGVSDFGALPSFLGAYEKWDDPEVVARYEKAWSVRLPTKKGLTSTEMVDAALRGSLRAMVIFGEDKVLADAHESQVRSALQKLDLLVVCEVVPTATSQLAHVVLPAAVTLEREGSMVNTERRIQRFHRALPPLGDSRPEFEIVQALANALGAHWNYARPADVMAEASAMVPRFAGVRYDRLEGYASQQWPVSADGTDSPYLYADRFAFPDGKAHFHPPKWIPPLASDAEYDLYLNNGRVLEQFHWGNLTSRERRDHGEDAGDVPRGLPRPRARARALGRRPRTDPLEERRDPDAGRRHRPGRGEGDVRRDHREGGELGEPPHVGRPRPDDPDRRLQGAPGRPREAPVDRDGTGVPAHPERSPAIPRRRAGRCPGREEVAATGLCAARRVIPELTSRRDPRHSRG